MAVLKPFQIKVVQELLENYQYDQPFHNYFSNLCKQHRNWGSKDRKTYRNTAYAWLRLGFASGDSVSEADILKGVGIAEALEKSPSAIELFPNIHLFSKAIDPGVWTTAMLKQKPLYIVIRKHKEKQVEDFLNEKAISFSKVGQYGLELPAESKCDELIEKGWAWVMDLASQEAAQKIEISRGNSVWDACSGAGGKSLYISNANLDTDFKLCCSDLRFGILENLKSRFQTLGFRNPRVELSDLTDGFQLSEMFDKIILDVPCTGSGTWGRTPENIRGFQESKLEYYTVLQKKIFRNAIKHLAPGGRLYYITCSVFKAENEDNFSYFIENHGLKEVFSEYQYSKTGDSDFLYVSALEKKVI